MQCSCACITPLTDMSERLHMFHFGCAPLALLLVIPGMPNVFRAFKCPRRPNTRMVCCNKLCRREHGFPALVRSEGRQHRCVTAICPSLGYG